MSVARIKRIITAAVLAMGLAGQAAAQANVTFFPTQYIAALADPEADPNLRRRALRAYGLFLLGLKGGLLLLLAPFLPSAPYPPLLLLAVLGVAWLYLQARSALEEEAPLGPLVAVGLGAAAFFFLGVLGLLLRPLGLLLLPLGLGAFWGFLRRGEEGLNAGARGP